MGFREWWKKISYWEKSIFMSFIFIVVIIIIINIILVSSELYDHVKNGVNQCSMGFAGTVPCKLGDAISNNIFLFNTTIGIVLYPLVLVIVTIFLLITKKPKNAK